MGDAKAEKVELNNATFLSGSDCRCVGTESVTIRPGITVKSGGKVTIKAPEVRILKGFRAENGATVKINKDSLPGQAVEMEVEWRNQEIKTVWSGKIGSYGTGSGQWWL